jgi:hypothetical protein
VGNRGNILKHEESDDSQEDINDSSGGKSKIKERSDNHAAA